jgi:hypothetical protein
MNPKLDKGADRKWANSSDTKKANDLLAENRRASLVKEVNKGFKKHNDCSGGSGTCSKDKEAYTPGAGKEQYATVEVKCVSSNSGGSGQFNVTLPSN